MATLDQVSTNNSINIFFFQNLTEKVRNQGMSIFNQRNYLIFSPIFFISEMYLEISHKIVNRWKSLIFPFFFFVKTLTSQKIIKCLVSPRAKKKTYMTRFLLRLLRFYYYVPIYILEIFYHSKVPSYLTKSLLITMAVYVHMVLFFTLEL